MSRAAVVLAAVPIGSIPGTTLTRKSQHRTQAMLMRSGQNGGN
jgi:hypothetical protein